MSLLLLASTLSLLGCPGPIDDTGERLGRVTYDALDGTVGYHTSRQDEALCDVDIHVVGTPSDYAGDCNDCDFVLDVEGTVTADDSNGDCALDPLYSFVPTEEVYDFRLFHQSFGVYSYYGYYYYYYYYSYGGTEGAAMWLEYTRATTNGPEQATIVLADASDPDFMAGGSALSGNVLTWNWFSSPAVTYYNYHYLSACSGMKTWTSAEDPASTLSDTETLTIDGRTGDYWAIEVPVDAPELRVSVDTVAANTEFQPRLVLNGPDGCTWVVAQQNFPCSPGGSDELCAGWHTELPAAGTWHAAVLNDHTLSTTHNSYRFAVDGALGLELLEDDFAAWREEHPVTLQVSMVATLTEAE